MNWSDLLSLTAGELIAPTTAAYALAAIGLNIHFGFTGLLNMGQAGFMLVGAYGFAATAQAEQGFALSALVGVGCAVVFALILGIPTLKLRGDYLAIVTISAAEIVRLTGRSSVFSDLTNGAAGIPASRFNQDFLALSVLPDGRTALGPFNYSNNVGDGWWTRIVAWVVVLLAVLLVWRLMSSPWGRVLKGIREDEDAVRSLGKGVYGYKMQALVLGGAMAGFAGILFVMPASVQPDAMGRSMTFFIWTILLLGGAATLWGPVIGSMIFFVALMLIKTVMRDLLPPSVMKPEQLEPLAGILVGITLMLLVIYRPQGIFGDKKELMLDVR
ncbi:branched-chain amino acid ABC transporter permease [uncultured Cellulomonas sp.]|uniref:branched-chain amino acid ABC transporter permease n=1 Tax=uncultured Cellulomonas sp. TaxID=189682 RepID=UPI0028EB9BFA|nr:branched-chain amino acid ABC transporter permease [uncultured Cellulomonas sp.]